MIGNETCSMKGIGMPVPFCARKVSAGTSAVYYGRLRPSEKAGFLRYFP